MDLVGTMDIAEMLGVPRNRAHELVNRKGFPDPVATVGRRTKVWSRDHVLAWMHEHRYDISPPPGR